MPELPNNQPHQSPKQSCAEDHTEQIEATSEEYHRWRTGRLQSRKEHDWADFQPMNPLWEISPAPAIPLPCLHRPQESLQQGFACSFVGNHEEVQHQRQESSKIYDKATSAVFFSSNRGDWFRTTAEVRLGCLLSPTLFNIYLERIIKDALEDHEGTASIGGRTITNLCFADDIDGLAGKKEELAKLTECLDKASTALACNQCQEGQVNDKQHQQHQHRNQNKWTEAWDCHKLQVPRLSYNWWGSQAWDALQGNRWQQCWRGWNQFWLTGVFLSLPRYDWCSPLSYPSSCVFVNHGPSQQSSKEEYKPLKWGATERYYTSHTKTMLPTRKSMPRSSR